MIEIDPPDRKSVQVKLTAAGLASTVLQLVSGMDYEVKRFLVRYISKEIDKEHIREARVTRQRDELGAGNLGSRPLAVDAHAIGLCGVDQAGRPPPGQIRGDRALGSGGAPCGRHGLWVVISVHDLIGSSSLSSSPVSSTILVIARRLQGRP